MSEMILQDQFEWSYISWTNLDRCDGGKSYLDTAVQSGETLYTGRTQTLKSAPCFLQYSIKKASHYLLPRH